MLEQSLNGDNSKNGEIEGLVTHVYRDGITGKELFRHTALNHMIADEMFTKKTGKDPTRAEDNVTLTFEKPEKQRYVYRDNFAEGKIVFECEATSLLEADEKYRETTKQDVSKQSHIGCQIEKILEKTEAVN